MKDNLSFSNFIFLFSKCSFLSFFLIQLRQFVFKKISRWFSIGFIEDLKQLFDVCTGIDINNKASIKNLFNLMNRLLDVHSSAIAEALHIIVKRMTFVYKFVQDNSQRPNITFAVVGGFVVVAIRVEEDFWSHRTGCSAFNTLHPFFTSHLFG